MSRLSPETVDLVDALVGVVAMAKRARRCVEDAKPSPSTHDGTNAEEVLPAADDAFVDVLVGLVALSSRLEGELERWSGPARPAADPKSPVPLRDFLR